jgi:uncharacterized protein YecT (DUF1311 family)
MMATACSSPSTKATPPKNATTPSSSVFVPIPSLLGTGPAQAAAEPIVDCGTEQSTVDMLACFSQTTENLDVKINQVQLARFQGATATNRAAILDDDASWLSARVTVCGAIPQTGGSLDRVSAASCRLNLTRARLYALQGGTVPVSHLTGGNGSDSTTIDYYATPNGSLIGLIGMAQSQDTPTATAGTFDWFVIGGYQGFVVHPEDFPFVDGSVVDHGTVQADARLNPFGSSSALIQPVTGYRLATTESLSFSIAYPHRGADPNAANPTGRFQYESGGVVLADWK